MRVAYQGIAGAFSEQAVAEALGPEIEGLPCPSFEAVLVAVEQGASARGVLPLVNSLAGVVPPVARLLLQRRPAVHGAVDVAVRHQLLGLPGASLAGLREVRSHPHALRQCQATLARLGVRAVEAANTAVAALEVADGNDPAVAAIASERAARRYGLEVLLPDVHDAADNTTRFVVVGPAPAPLEGAWRLVVTAAAGEGEVLWREPAGVLVQTRGPVPEGGVVLGAYDAPALSRRSPT